MLTDAVPNNELRNGYHVQFVDEIHYDTDARNGNRLTLVKAIGRGKE